jgi:hypothetical protein
MPTPIFSKNTKQHLTRHEISDKIWTILVILGLASAIIYSLLIQILHHP